MLLTGVTAAPELTRRVLSLTKRGQHGRQARMSQDAVTLQGKGRMSGYCDTLLTPMAGR